MIKVSVIIPVYNSARYLAMCLESCIEQSLKDIEIICVNDVSQDNSSEILHEFAQQDDRIKIIDRPNLHAGEARNEGVNVASGEYLIFVDSDDWLEKNALEILYNKLKNDGSDVVLFNVYNYFEETKIRNLYNFVSPYFYKLRKELFTPFEIKDVIFDTNPLPFKMYSRKTWVENNIEYSKHKFTEDALPFFKFLINSKKISIEQKPLYNYRRHKESATANFSKYSKDMFDVFYTCEKAILENKNSECFINSFVKNRINHILFWYPSLDFSQKRQYFYEMRKVFKHILEKYGADVIEKNSHLKRVYSIVKYPYYIEMLMYRFTLLSILADSYFV